jgi:hypothetical protein
MSDVPDRDIEISNFLPVPYVTQYTDRTSTFSPLMVTALTGWAVLMIDWGSLRWIDHAPVAIWIGSTAIAICVLAVIANRDWLNFKNKKYFPISLSALMAVWLGIVGFAYYLDVGSDHLVDPAISKLQTQVASANRERDAAILERDNALRANNTASPLLAPSQPNAPPSLKAEDAEARIDVWKSIEGQMNDFSRVLGEGDAIVAKWTTNQSGLSPAIFDFRQHFQITRNRLAQLIGTYSDFSDLKIIDQGATARLSSTVENLLQALSQLPQNILPSDYESMIGPYIGQLKRELEPVKKWTATTKSLANSSVSELSYRQISK